MRAQCMNVCEWGVINEFEISNAQLLGAFVSFYVGCNERSVSQIDKWDNVHNKLKVYIKFLYSLHFWMNKLKLRVLYIQQQNKK